MDSPISFSGTPNRDTLYRAVRLATLPSTASMVIRALLALLIAGVYITLIVQALLNPERTTPDLLQIAARMLTLLVLLYLILRPFIEPYFVTRRLWEQPSSRQPVAGTVDNQGVTIHAQGGSRIIPWERVARARARDDLLVLVTREGEVIHLPLAFFQSEADWQAAREQAGARRVG